MKKKLIAALCCLTCSSVFAQDAETVDVSENNATSENANAIEVDVSENANAIEVKVDVSSDVVDTQEVVSDAEEAE